MKEGTKTALLAEGRVDEGIVERAVAAAEAAPPAERVIAGLEAAIAFAETDPVAARSALSDLRGNYAALTRLERCLDHGTEERAVFGLGAAIQLALVELDSPEPDLRSRTPELSRWLEGDW